MASEERQQVQRTLLPDAGRKERCANGRKVAHEDRLARLDRRADPPLEPAEAPLERPTGAVHCRRRRETVQALQRGADAGQAFGKVAAQLFHRLRDAGRPRLASKARLHRVWIGKILYLQPMALHDLRNMRLDECGAPA